MNPRPIPPPVAAISIPTCFEVAAWTMGMMALSVVIRWAVLAA